MSVVHSCMRDWSVSGTLICKWPTNTKVPTLYITVEMAAIIPQSLTLINMLWVRCVFRFIHYTFMSKPTGHIGSKGNTYNNTDVWLWWLLKLGVNSKHMLSVNIGNDTACDVINIVMSHVQINLKVAVWRMWIYHGPWTAWSHEALETRVHVPRQQCCLNTHKVQGNHTTLKL